MKLLVSAMILMSSVSTYAASRECVLEAKAAGEAISRINFPRSVGAEKTRAVLLGKIVGFAATDYVYDIMPGRDPMGTNFKVEVSRLGDKCTVTSVKEDANG